MEEREARVAADGARAETEVVSGDRNTIHMRPADLVGRSTELAHINELAYSAATGLGCVLLIEGEPGIGKTALLRDVLRDSAQRFALRVDTAAEEFDLRLPFATLAGCLRSAVAAGRVNGGADERVAAILDLVREEGGRTEAQYRVVEAVLGLVEDWCAEGPVIWAVDDLQWADPASLLVLHRLGRVARQLPLFLLAASRTGASAPEVALLLRSWQTQHAEKVVLGPLGTDAVE